MSPVSLKLATIGPQVQLNLVNLKSSGLEVLFRIISSLNYREVDLKIYNPQNDYYQVFSIKHKFQACKKNLSKRCFFYTPKTYVIVDSY